MYNQNYISLIPKLSLYDKRVIRGVFTLLFQIFTKFVLLLLVFLKLRKDFFKFDGFAEDEV